MSQIIVLDTHIWFWLINRDFDRFPAFWRDEIESADRVGVSPVSCYEIALAHQKGRLTLPTSPENWLSLALAPSDIELMPLQAEVSIQAVNLSPVHKDPFDRLIIATALVYQAKLASIDTLFQHYAELTDVLMPKTRP